MAGRSSPLCQDQLGKKIIRSGKGDAELSWDAAMQTQGQTKLDGVKGSTGGKVSLQMKKGGKAHTSFSGGKAEKKCMKQGIEGRLRPTC